jgi:hypothetical protein
MQPTSGGRGFSDAGGAAVGRRLARAALGPRVDRGAVAWRVREGRLHRIHAGVYAVGHARVAWRGHMVAAVLACGAGCRAEPRERRDLVGLLSLDAAVRIDVSVRQFTPRRPRPRAHRGRLPLAEAPLDRGNRRRGVARNADGVQARPAKGRRARRGRPPRRALHLERRHPRASDGRAKARKAPRGVGSRPPP